MVSMALISRVMAVATASRGSFHQRLLSATAALQRGHLGARRQAVRLRAATSGRLAQLLIGQTRRHVRAQLDAQAVDIQHLYASLAQRWRQLSDEGQLALQERKLLLSAARIRLRSVDTRLLRRDRLLARIWGREHHSIRLSEA